MRTIIDLTAEQISGLEQLCRDLHISRAEAVRRAVDTLLKDSERESFEAAMDRAATAWQAEHRGESTDEYLEKIRAEWER